MWEETGAPGEKTHINMGVLETPHSNDRGLSCNPDRSCHATVLNTEPPHCPGPEKYGVVNLVITAAHDASVFF